MKSDKTADTAKLLGDEGTDGESREVSPQHGFNSLRSRIYVASSTVHRAIIVLGFCVTQIDMSLDGAVLIQLVGSGFQIFAITLLLSIIVPQVVVWAFLRQNDMSSFQSLGRILLLPFVALVVWLSLCQLNASYQWLRDGALLACCISLEPLHHAIQGWSAGKEQAESIWTAIAEGLLEAPCSSFITLYPVLLTGLLRERVAMPVFFSLSLAMSFVSIARCATKLHFYGTTPSSFEWLRTWLFLMLPRVVSQMLGLTFFFLLTRPVVSGVSDDEELHDMRAHLGLAFLVTQIILNFAMLSTASKDLDFFTGCLFSLTMFVAGPPGFLQAFERIQAPHALMQFSLLSFGTIVALDKSPLGSEQFDVLMDLPILVSLFVVCAPVALVATLVASRSKEISLEERAELAHGKFAEALGARDKIMCNLTLRIDGAKPRQTTTFSKTGVRGEYMWMGLATCCGKVFCAPFHIPTILVIDAATLNIRLIETGTEGNFEWLGATSYGSKVFFSPCNSSKVMVLDANTDEIHFIEIGVEGGDRFAGITAFGSKLYCCPRNASSVLVIDASTESTHYIAVDYIGSLKWEGAAVCQGRLYFCPSHATAILVLDLKSEKVHFIETGQQGEFKWAGVIAYNNKLYFSPFHDSRVLVLDAETEKIHFIPCEVEGWGKWQGVAVFEGNLYFCPCNADGFLVLDPSTEKTHIVPCGVTGNSKWSGSVSCGGRVFCSPCNQGSVLILEDEPALLETLFNGGVESR